MSIPAFTYCRFSTLEQSKGHSLKRQLEGGKSYIERKGWLWDESRNLIEEGKSAYHGANRDAGSALFDFEQKARAGHFANGAVLVVENLDRLTRQGYEDTFDLVRAFTGNGVTVATWQDDHVFQAGERIELMAFLKLLITSERALEESAAKSKRMKAVWKKKYEAAEQGDRQAITGTLPGWLELDRETRLMRPIPHRVTVLNEIYDDYISGKGLPWIERKLNQRGEPNWGRGKHSGKPWGVDRLHKYLTSRSVLGEFVPKTRKGNGERSAAGAPIPDYYPQVITSDKFNQAQAVRKGRKGWGGRNQQSLPNLFTGMATCRECGGKMMATAFIKAGQTRTQKLRSGKGVRTYTEPKDKGYLTCRNAIRKLGCTNKTFYPYYPLEAGVLEYLWEFAMRGQFITPNSEAAKLTNALAEQERLLAHKRQQVETLASNLMQVQSATLTRNLVALEEEVEQDEQSIQALRKELAVELGKAPPEQDLEAVKDARSALTSTDPDTRYAARTRTHQSLKRLINHMECQPNGDTLFVFGNYGAGITFNRDGKCTDRSALNARYEGPDGEPDWQP